MVTQYGPHVKVSCTHCESEGCSACRVTCCQTCCVAMHLHHACSFAYAAMYTPHLASYMAHNIFGQTVLSNNFPPGCGHNTALGQPTGAGSEANSSSDEVLTRVISSLLTDAAQHAAPRFGLRPGLASHPPLPVPLSCNHKARLLIAIAHFVDTVAYALTCTARLADHSEAGFCVVQQVDMIKQLYSLWSQEWCQSLIPLSCLSRDLNVQ